MLLRRFWEHRALRVWGLALGNNRSPAVHPHPMRGAVALALGPLQVSLSAQRCMPAQGTSVAWQEEVLDPGDIRGSLKVLRPQV